MSTTTISQKNSRQGILRRASGGVAWTMVGHFGHRVLGAVAAIAVARILGTAVYGQYAVVQSTMRMFTVFAGFRLGSTSTKYIAQYRQGEPIRAARVLKLVLYVSLATCLLLALILWALSGHLARTHLQRPELASTVAISAALLFFMMLGNVTQKALAGFEDFRGIAMIGLARGIVSLLVCIPLAWAFGINGAMVALVIVAAVAAGQTLYYVFQAAKRDQLPTTVSWKESVQEWSILSSFALPAVLTGFILTAVAWYGRTALLNTGEGDTQMGLFGAADQWRMIVLFLPSALSHVALPILSQSHSSGEEGAFNNAISVNVEIVYRITLPLAFAISALAIPLTLLYGKGFENAAPVIPVIMLSVFIHSVNQAVRQAYGGAGRVWTNLGMHVAWAGVYLLACHQLLVRFGAYGFAWVHVAADLSLFLIQVFYVEAYLAPGSLRQHWKTITFGACLFLLSILAGESFGAPMGALAATVGMLMVSLPTLKTAWDSRTSIYQRLQKLIS